MERGGRGATDEPVAHVVATVNVLLSVVFLGDFGYRLAAAPNRGRYLVRRFGWADLPSALRIAEVMGVCVFGTLTGYLANLFLARTTRRRRGAGVPDDVRVREQIDTLRDALVVQQESPADLEELLIRSRGDERHKGEA
jgi:hypothetical protein